MCRTAVFNREIAQRFTLFYNGKISVLKVSGLDGFDLVSVLIVIDNRILLGI